MESILARQARPGPFVGQQTRWSLVGRASGRWGDEAREAALEQWFNDYSRPIVAWFVRERRTWGDGEDAAQDFMQHLFESNWFAKVDAARGSLRAYLLGAMRNFLLSWIRSSRKISTGGVATRVTYDDQEVLRSEVLQDVDTPDALFHRQWALSVLHEAVSAMEQAWTSRGKGPRFQQLRPRLFPEGAHSSEGAIPPAERQAIVRARRELGRWLRAIVARDIGSDDPDAIREEIRSLRSAL